MLIRLKTTPYMTARIYCWLIWPLDNIGCSLLSCRFYLWFTYPPISNADSPEQRCLLDRQTLLLIYLTSSSYMWLAWPPCSTVHCKDKMPKIWKKYSQKRNNGASVPISRFMCLWAKYIFPRWVCLFFWRKYVDRSWEYINRSQTHECWNWGWGRAIPRKGIYKRNYRCSVKVAHLTAISVSLEPASDLMFMLALPARLQSHIFMNIQGKQFTFLSYSLILFYSHF